MRLQRGTGVLPRAVRVMVMASAALIDFFVDRLLDFIIVGRRNVSVKLTSSVDRRLVVILEVS